MNEEKIDFVKIDVENYEKYVLLGAIKFFNKFRPMVFIEHFRSEHYGENHDNFVYNFFKELNYNEPIKFPVDDLFIHKNSNMET